MNKGVLTVDIQLVQLRIHRHVALSEQRLCYLLVDSKPARIQERRERGEIHLSGFPVRLVKDVLSIAAELRWFTSAIQRFEVFFPGVGEINATTGWSDTLFGLVEGPQVAHRKRSPSV